MDKNRLVLTLLGFLAGLLLVVAEFLPWFSGHTAMEISFWNQFVPQFGVYFFPLLSGMATLAAAVLYAWSPRRKFYSALLDVISLSLIFLFYLQIFHLDFIYVGSIQVGFYVCLLGTILVFLEVIVLLLVEPSISEEAIP